MKQTSVLLSSVALGLLVTFPSLIPIHAATAEEEKEAAIFEEIVVTARKREESLQETPLAITAFTSEGLEKANIKNLVDIADFTPGFSFASAFGRQGDRPVIRGMSSIQGGANASVFVDGVFVTGSSQSILLDNLERVEVIKGPQSALYGRATFGGAVNYITRRPTEELGGRISATAAEYDNFEFSGFLSGPFMKDKIYFDIGAKYYTFGGDYENSFPGLEGEKVGAEETYTVNGTLLFYPAAGLEVIVRANYSEDDDGHYAIALQGAEANNCFLGVAREYFCGDVPIPEGGPRLETNFFEDTSGIRRETWRTSLTLNLDIGGHQLTSITAYADRNVRTIQDQTFGGTDRHPFGFRFGFITDEKDSLEDVAQELRLISPAENAFRYIVGGYYYKQTTEEVSRGSDGPPDADFGFDGKTEVRNYALFGQVEYDVSEKLTVSAELRYAEDKLEVLTADIETFEETYTSWTPRFTLDYQASEDVLFYGVVSRGNKPGGFNTNSGLDPDLIPIEEENLWNYEIGMKSVWMDNRLLLNLAAYYLDWSDQQLTQNILINNNPDSITVNVGKTETYGFEAELKFALSRELSVEVIYAFTHPEIQNFDLSGDRFNEAEQLGFKNGIVKGTFTPQSPKHTLTLSGEYRTGLGSSDLEFFARTDYIYSSTRYAQVFNLAGTGDRHIVNLRTGVENDRYRISLWAKNLFDNDTPTSILRYVDVPSFFQKRAFAVSLPRKQQFGITGSVRF
ncbi:TonB-dependent receptor [Luteithermobacter gelatinilyticus]|uniref:TonB-dependent receptor n=1 Tax=Luteithermobacter gelatinilyticus TaxID=2582913 RepID=UPI001106287A|nr:TonB-dependent receptor [Luteithermobacter gelatinilyticus]